MNDRAQTKVISEPKELYRFLAMPGIEVTNLEIARVNVGWISWKHAAEKYLLSLRHTNEVIVAYVTAGQGLICIVISTGCKRKRSIATQIL